MIDMKYLKRFENINEPEVGDYVICEEEDIGNNIITNFTSNNIGTIVEINNYNRYQYVIKYENVYENIPLEIREMSFYDDTRKMTRSEIIHYSKNKEDLEIILNANKYNL